MRIISGRFKGRKLATPENSSIRPTSDKVREAVFSIIASKISNARVLDLFAGTGAFGLEALSRGACHATFVDISSAAAATIRKNTDLAGIGNQAAMVRGSIPDVLKRSDFSDGTFDIIFLDPPYNTNLILRTLNSEAFLNLITDTTVVIAEHPASPDMIEPSVSLAMIDRRKYGKTFVSFFQNNDKTES